MSNSTFLRTGLIAVVGLLGMASGAQAVLIHSYQLNGTLADSLGGPSLVESNAAAGTLSPTGYSFAAASPNAGLSLSNALPSSSVYSIETVFDYATLTAFRKIIDFKNLTSDTGLYNLNTALDFFNVATGPAGAFAPLVDSRLILTDDGVTVTGYVNGVPQISFVDASSLAVFSGPNNIINFFQDDFVTGQGESSAGHVSLINIYDAPLSAVQVAALGGPALPAATPEPSSIAMVGSGLLPLACRLRRRRRESAMAPAA